MASDFVPLAPKAPHGAPDGGFRLKVLPQPEAAPSFHAHSIPVAGGAAPGTAGEPVITLTRDGDRVTGVRIQCTCGHVIDLICEF